MLTLWVCTRRLTGDGMCIISIGGSGRAMMTMTRSKISLPDQRKLQNIQERLVQIVQCVKMCDAFIVLAVIHRGVFVDAFVAMMDDAQLMSPLSTFRDNSNGHFSRAAVPLLLAL